MTLVIRLAGGLTVVRAFIFALDLLIFISLLYLHVAINLFDTGTHIFFMVGFSVLKIMRETQRLFLYILNGNTPVPVNVSVEQASSL
jgi:hypothetical protein